MTGINGKPRIYFWMLETGKCFKSGVSCYRKTDDNYAIRLPAKVTSLDLYFSSDEVITPMTDDEVIESEARKQERSKRKNTNAKARSTALRDLGLNRVKGALGGTYWE